jgi:hypothetical protein
MGFMKRNLQQLYFTEKVWVFKAENLKITGIAAFLVFNKPGE